MSKGGLLRKMQGGLDLGLLSGRMKPEGWAASPALESRGATGVAMLLARLRSTAQKAKFWRYPGKSVLLAEPQFPHL